MSKTRRNRWSGDLTQREQERLRKKGFKKQKADKVRDRLEERRANRLQRGESE